MWKGVTEFLENVDQKAAEYAQRKENESPLPAPKPTVSAPQELPGDDEENWDLEGALEADQQIPSGLNKPSPSAGGEAPLPQHVIPPPPSVSGASSTSPSTTDTQVLRQQLALMTKKFTDAQRQHDAAISERDKSFLSLQGDYDAVTAKNRSLAIEADHWQTTAKRLEEERSMLDVRAQGAEKELNEERARQHAEASSAEQWEMQCNDQLTQLEEQRRDIATAQAHARKATDALAALEEELSSYKLRTKISFSEKERQIADLQQSLEAAQSASPATTTAADPHVAAEPEKRSSAAAEAIDAALHQAEARVRSLTEQLQQRNNEYAKCDESLRAQQLLNAQLKELLDGEHSNKAAAAKAFEARLAEKQSMVEAAERKLSQVQMLSGAGSGGEQLASASSGDMERRAKELAQLLMEKQSALESKRAEVDQWRTRYEVSQQRLREAELVSTALHRSGADSTTSRRNPSKFNDIASAEAQDADSVAKHRLMTNLASKGGIGAKVVGVADQVDRFSLRAGVLLRQHSLLRVFVVCYVIILQLYMFIVTSVSSSIPDGNAHEGVLKK